VSRAVHVLVGSEAPRAASSVVEHLTFNQGVPGSIPGRPTTFRFQQCNNSATQAADETPPWQNVAEWVR
jgi:hypothetical protein